MVLNHILYHENCLPRNASSQFGHFFKSLLEIGDKGSSLFENKSRAGTLKERRNKRMSGRKPIPIHFIFLTAKYGGNYIAFCSSASYCLIQLKALRPPHKQAMASSQMRIIVDEPVYQQYFFHCQSQLV
jgi:hypothetical protein